MAHFEIVPKGWLGAKTEYILHLTPDDIENVSDMIPVVGPTASTVATATMGIPAGVTAVILAIPFLLIKRANKKYGKRGVQIRVQSGWLKLLNPLMIFKPFSAFKILPPQRPETEG
ncbi:MAG TPA: hypothetical protein VGO55_02230 [Allosphingosinicella sp.]|jgi:hypothetical protein|nr:hypothetical protein [Allosphingosinicella sp.]